MKKERIDKVLANLGYGSRKDIYLKIKSGDIIVNGATVKQKDLKVDPINDEIKVGGNSIEYRKSIYIMLNKPCGVVSSTDDPKNDTVLQLLDESLLSFKPFPAGRLDKDTVGFVLLTNDGDLAHQILSPKKNKSKVYEAVLDGEINNDKIKKLENGVKLKDGYITKPAKLKVLSKQPKLIVEIELIEGKYHQVKRMMATQGLHVIQLKRTKLAGLELDKNLAEGEYRELTLEEIQRLKSL